MAAKSAAPKSEEAFADFLQWYMRETRFNASDIAFFTRSSEKSVYQWRSGVGPDPRLRNALRAVLQTHQAQFEVLRNQVERLNKGA